MNPKAHQPQTASLFDTPTTTATNVVPLSVVPDPIRIQEQLIQAEGPALTRKTSELAQRSSAYATITSQSLYAGAEQLAKEVQANNKAIKALHDPVVEHWYAKHQTACTARKSMLDPGLAVFGKLKAAMEAYVRLAAQRRREQEQRDQAAALALQQSRASNHQQLCNTPATPVPATPVFAVPLPIARAPQLSTSHQRTQWQYEVTDMMTVLRAVVAGKIPLEAVQVNDTFVCKQVEQYRTSLRYPGIRVFEDAKISIRQ